MDCLEHENASEICQRSSAQGLFFMVHELLEKKMANISENVSKVMCARAVSWNVESMEKLCRKPRLPR